MAQLSSPTLFLGWWHVKGVLPVPVGQLNLAQPTISGQIHALEEAAWGKSCLCVWVRHLVLTEVGRVVFRYATRSSR